MGLFSAEGTDMESLVLAVVGACRGRGASDVPTSAEMGFSFDCDNTGAVGLG